MVCITNEALEFLNKKGKQFVTIEYPDYRINCCGYHLPIPDIFVKKPKEGQRFFKETIDGIDVYLQKTLINLKNTDITIDITSCLGIKSLVVEGFKVMDYFK